MLMSHSDHMFQNIRILSIHFFFFGLPAFQQTRITLKRLISTKLLGDLSLLYWRSVDNSYQRSWAHVVSFARLTHIHTHLLPKVFLRLLRLTDDLESDFKSLEARTQKKMGGPAWVDSLFTTWKRVIHILPLYTVRLSDKHTHTQTTHGSLSSWIIAWPLHGTFSVVFYASLHQSTNW